MRPPSDVPRPQDYLRILAAGWVVIACATILSGGAGWWVWHEQEKVNAYVRFFVVAPAGAQPGDAQNANLSAMAKTVTYRGLAQSTEILNRAIADTNSTETPAQLAKRVTVGVTESVVLEMQVSGKDPDETQATANALAQGMVTLSKEIEAKDTGGTHLELVDAATGVSDGRGALFKQVLLGAAVGGGLSALLILALGLAHDSVLDRRQLGYIIDQARSRDFDR